jgi:hypothetical protein
MLFRILLLGYLSLAAASGDTTFPVAHRFLPHPDPSGVEAAWTPFGSISLSPGSGGSAPNGSFQPAIQESQKDETAASGWYQLSVDLGDGTSLITSVRAVRPSRSPRRLLEYGDPADHSVISHQRAERPLFSACPKRGGISIRHHSTWTWAERWGQTERARSEGKESSCRVGRTSGWRSVSPLSQKGEFCLPSRSVSSGPLRAPHWCSQP